MSTCKVPCCEKNVQAKGLCPAHYARLRKYGDPSYVKQTQFHGLSLTERFWKYTIQKGESECWPWVGNKDKRGYGRLMMDTGKKHRTPVLAHRISWIIHNGDIPNGKFVCHKCDNPACVNPSHLYVGTQTDNMRDMWNRNRANPGHVYGVKHGNAKMSEAQVREIRNSNDSCRNLAAKYGISPTHANDIRRKKPGNI